MNNQKFVSENLGAILKPKSREDVTNEIKRRLGTVDKTVKLEKNDFIIYQVNKGGDIKEIVKNFGGRDEDVFFNFYLILDNSVSGYDQIIGIKVGPDHSMTAMNANGARVDNVYLEKFS